MLSIYAVNKKLNYCSLVVKFLFALGFGLSSFEFFEHIFEYFTSHFKGDISAGGFNDAACDIGFVTQPGD